MTPEEILKKFGLIDQLGEIHSYSDEVIFAITEYGKQQWNEAIKLAAEEAQLNKKYYNIYDHKTMYERWKNKGYPRMDGYGSQSGVDVVSIDKQSILKLLK